MLVIKHKRKLEEKYFIESMRMRFIYISELWLNIKVKFKHRKTKNHNTNRKENIKDISNTLLKVSMKIMKIQLERNNFER